MCCELRDLIGQEINIHNTHISSFEQVYFQNKVRSIKLSLPLNIGYKIDNSSEYSGNQRVFLGVFYIFWAL